MGAGRLGSGQRLAAGVILGQGGVERLIRAGRGGEVRGEAPAAAVGHQARQPPRRGVGRVGRQGQGQVTRPLGVQAVRLAPEGQPDVRRRVGPGPGRGRPIGGEVSRGSLGLGRHQR